MSTIGSDTAEQLVRIYLEGIEVGLRVTGSAAKNIAAALYAVSQDKTKTKGKARLTSMLKSGKELKIFTVNKSDLKRFSQIAKKYGVLYSALIEKNNKAKDGVVDIMVRAEDASKINRIVERFNFASTVDVAKIEKSIELEKDKKVDKENKEPKIKKNQNLNEKKEQLNTSDYTQNKEVIEENSKEDKLVNDILNEVNKEKSSSLSSGTDKTLKKENQLEILSEHKNMPKEMKNFDNIIQLKDYNNSSKNNRISVIKELQIIKNKSNADQSEKNKEKTKFNKNNNFKSNNKNKKVQKNVNKGKGNR